MSDTVTSPSMETQLAVLSERIQTVIKSHEEKLVSHDTKHESTTAKVAVLQIQSNTHEVKLAALEEKAMGAFGKTAIFISTVVAALSLVWNVIK